ncbi:MAG: polysaccharide biosynthesis protein [Candidatus Improbicoccus devescovinae]|nr:MAG: polysaccharide biosynthesis protein [Candidatus Improbicoccus devescovinae]
MYNLYQKFKKYILFFMDFVIWNVAFYLSFAINKNSFSLLGFEKLFIECILIVNVCFVVIFFCFKMHDKIWRYADVEDFFYAGLSIFLSNFFFFVITFIRHNNLGIRMYVLFLLVSEFLNFMARLLYRFNRILETEVKYSTNRKKRLLIVGAGEATNIVLREIYRNSGNEYLPICIVDDDRSKIDRSVIGIKVRGSTYEISQICKNENIDVILFCILNINSPDRCRILDICARTNIELKIISSIYDTLTSNNSSMPFIRYVNIEDLLGRDPVVFDCKNYGNYLIGKTVLVTGGGGSIGAELCRQIALLEPKKLIILDIYENNAYEIQQELYRNYVFPNFKINKKAFDFEVQIASVRDSRKIDKIFLDKNIDIVFHAAAHKHVPLMEYNPEEAVKNNVFGTLNVAIMAEKYKIDKFVLISTDKAVNPTSIMGATKRICEMIIQLMNTNTSKTQFSAVRFGNVLGSNGSVIPLFKEQIKNKGPITVTHPDVIRYFMTISEAVALVLTAGGLAKGGEIHVLDMGEPVRIKDLAENLIRLSGLVPYSDIQIEYTGLRPGEKLYEEILMDEEGIKLTENNKIYTGNPIKFDEHEFKRDLEDLKIACKSNDTNLIRKIISKIVPISKNI